MKTAADVMQTSIVTVAPHDPLHVVQRLFYEEGIHGAPVIDELGQLQGIITSSDIMRAASETHDLPGDESSYNSDDLDLPFGWGSTPDQFRERLNDASVSNFMTHEVVCVAPETPVRTIARTLREQRIHRVLVTEQDKLCGLVSTFDLMALLEG
jgi:CBS domain-containing protein